LWGRRGRLFGAGLIVAADGFKGGFGMAVDPGGFASGHFEPGDVVVESGEILGVAGGEDRFGDDGFDHEVGDGVDFGGGEEVDGIVAGHEGAEGEKFEFGGPLIGGDGFVEVGAELDTGVGDIDGALLDAGGVEIDDTDDGLIDVEEIGGVPIGVGDLAGPLGKAEGIGGGCGLFIVEVERTKEGAEVVEVAERNAGGSATEDF